MRGECYVCVTVGGYYLCVTVGKTSVFCCCGVGRPAASHLQSAHTGRWILPSGPSHQHPPLHSSLLSSLFSSFPPCSRENASSCLFSLWHLPAHLSFPLFFRLLIQSWVGVKGAPSVGMAAWHKLSGLPERPLGCPSGTFGHCFLTVQPLSLSSCWKRAD